MVKKKRQMGEVPSPITTSTRESVLIGVMENIKFRGNAKKTKA